MVSGKEGDSLSQLFFKVDIGEIIKKVLELKQYGTGDNEIVAEDEDDIQSQEG